MPSERKRFQSYALRQLRTVWKRPVTKNNSMKKITLIAVAIATIATLSLPAADDAKPKAPRAKPTAEEIKKYDKDGDGKLSKEERAAMNADKKKDAPAK